MNTYSKKLNSLVDKFNTMILTKGDRVKRVKITGAIALEDLLFKGLTYTLDRLPLELVDSIDTSKIMLTLLTDLESGEPINLADFELKLSKEAN